MSTTGTVPGSVTGCLKWVEDSSSLLSEASWLTLVAVRTLSVTSTPLLLESLTAPTIPIGVSPLTSSNIAYGAEGADLCSTVLVRSSGVGCWVTSSEATSLGVVLSTTIGSVTGTGILRPRSAIVETTLG